MIDVITYTDNLPALRAWLENKKDLYKEISYDESGVWLNVAKVPTRTNGNHSASLLRVEDTGFLIDAPLEILAMGDNPHDSLDAYGDSKLELAMNRQEVTYTDPDTEEVHTYIEPLNIGVIA